jgi:hypothetical protein
MQNAGIAVKKWELFDELSFLDQHVKARRLFLVSKILRLYEYF